MQPSVLVVSEDRDVMRKIDFFLPKDTCVKYNLHSCNAFRFFVEQRAALVILDSGVSEGADRLLKQFSMCQWPHICLTLAEGDKKTIQQENVWIVPFAFLEDERFRACLSAAFQTLPDIGSISASRPSETSTAEARRGTPLPLTAAEVSALIQQTGPLMHAVLFSQQAGLLRELDTLQRTYSQIDHPAKKDVLYVLLRDMVNRLTWVSGITANDFDPDDTSENAWIPMLSGILAEQRDQIAANNTNTVLKNTLLYLFQHVSDGPSLSGCAEALQVSANYINLCLRNTFGKTFLSLAKERQLVLAKGLLTNTDLKIHEIATLLGFSDRHYFSRVFKDTAGLTPEQFREARGD